MFNVSSGQIEMMAELSFKHKQAVVIGEGKGVSPFEPIYVTSFFYIC